jgi:hypothetical protein
LLEQLAYIDPFGQGQIQVGNGLPRVARRQVVDEPRQTHVTGRAEHRVDVGRGDVSAAKTQELLQ